VNVQNYPNVLESVIEKGHELGNHTFSHQILKSASANKIKNEISDTEDALYDRYSLRTNLLRPPCGLYDSNLVNIARENGYKIVLWTVDTKDWAHESAENIVKNVLANIKSGDIILFHDYVSGNDHTAEALNILIPKLQEMGYKFVTVSELLQS
jgi:peptidoglycan/xylan/chitin deacetylase (PgdA/CDA1 family)